MVASPTQKAPVWYVPNVLRGAIKDFGKNMSFGTVNGNNNDNITLIIVIIMTIMIIIIKMSNFRDKNISKK